jgi:hypothetical protein
MADDLHPGALEVEDTFRGERRSIQMKGGGFPGWEYEAADLTKGKTRALRELPRAAIGRTV